MLIARSALVLRWAVCAVLLAALSGCAGAVVPTPAAGATPTAGLAGGVTLVLWHGWSSGARQSLSRLVERFNRQHPDGRVILQSVPLTSFDSDLRAALNYGGGPHLILIPSTWVGSLTERDALLSLDDLIAPAETQALLPAALGGARALGSDGKQHLYGLPISFDTLAMYYDKRNVLTPPADTAALLQSARGLSAPSGVPPRWGLGLNLSIDNMIGYLYAAGGRVFGDDGGVALGETGRAGAEQWLAWLAQLQSDPQLLARAENSIQVDRELKDGHVLMTFDWAHQIALYRSLWGENLGVAPLPRLSATGQPPQPYVKSDVLAVNGRVGSGERQAALAFLRFMISADAQPELLQSDLQPARSDLKLDGPELDSQRAMAASAFRSQAQLGRPMPNLGTREREILRRELASMQRQVLRGEAAPADAVTEADRRLREQLAATTP